MPHAYSPVRTLRGRVWPRANRCGHARALPCGHGNGQAAGQERSDSGNRHWPVGGSRSGGRKIRCTAARIPSATVARKSQEASARASVRVGEIAQLQPYGRHTRPAEQLPALRSGSGSRLQVRAGDDLAVHQLGEALADHGAGPARCRSSRSRPRVRGGSRAPSACRETRRSASVSFAVGRALLVAGVLPRVVGEERVHSHREQPSLELAGEVVHQVPLGRAPSTAQPGIVAAVSGVDHDRLARERGAASAQLSPPRGARRAVRRRRCAAAGSVPEG